MPDQSPEDFLRSYQLLVASTTGITTDTNAEHMRQNIDEIEKISGDFTEEERREHQRAIEDSATESDIVRQISRRLLEVLPPSERARLESIPVGALPTLDFNASTIRSPSGPPIIVIDGGLVAALHTAVSAYVAGEDFTGFPAQITDMEATSLLFSITMFHLTRNAELFRPQLINPESAFRRGMVGAITQYAVYFVLGHEYGHAALGHLDEAPLRSIAISGGALPSLDGYEWSHEREFAADAFGAQLALAAAKVLHPQGALLGAALGTEFMLRMIWLAEQYIPQRRLSASHPPAAERIERLHEAWQREHGNEFMEFVQIVCRPFDAAAFCGKEVLGGLLRDGTTVFAS